MLTSRKDLISNLNYVHLQHVSLGVHLSMRTEKMEGPVGQDASLKDVHAHQHQYKDTSEMVLVDANSNDPSVPCQCCDHHSSHAETLKYCSNENLETIMCEDYLSPDDLPLSPLSPTSPSTDSSSSSDFTLDDSPVSMYYKEYAQDDLDTPDQEPDIIPLDVETEDSASSLEDSIDPSHVTTTIVPRGKIPENTVNNNLDPEDVPFIDWGSDTVLDSNCNALLDTQQPEPLSLYSASVDVDTVVDPKPQPEAVEEENVGHANQTDVPQWSLDGNLPSRSVLEDTSTQTPKKTITSFHELAQKRRKSGGPPQSKKDKSDWLIVFSPDVEQPPVNELTASAFYHGLVMPHAQPLPEGKEVTTFRELRYRNSVNKQTGQHAKAHSTVFKGPQDSAEGVTDAADVQNAFHCFIDKWSIQDTTRDSDKQEGGSQEANNGSTKGIQRPDKKLQQLDTPEALHRLWVQSDHRPGTLVDPLSAMSIRMGKRHLPTSINNMYSRNEEIPAKEKMAGVQRRGMADGGDRRGLEAFVAPSPSRLLLQLSTNLTPPPALLSPGSTLEVPRCFALPPQSWYPRLPIRLSPVGASSPPQRALLPLLDTPDVAILLSPLFPRNWSRATGSPGAPTIDSPDTGGEPLMADGNSLQRDKKSLLVAIGSSVDRIISHFNGSRNQVQKAQLGDSRLSPKLGYLILNSLCPSLFSLLGDGLKPFQKDIIIGRRRLNPWNLVEASTKSGPESLHILFYNVSQYHQLRDPQRRFNAFIFGLLNTKQLDLWASHLHQIYDQLAVYFHPTGFLPLAATSCPELREELLLILQPLSALTFHTDLLFEHHHLPLQDLPTPQSPSTQTLANSWGVPPFQHILDLGGWLTHNLTGNTDREKPKESQTHSPSSSIDPQHDGSVRSRDSSKDSYGNQGCLSSPTAGITNAIEIQQSATSKTKDLSTTWWGQLSQASRQYIPATKDSFTLASFRRQREGPDKEWSNLEQQLSHKIRESTEPSCPVEPHCERDSQKTENGTEPLRQPTQGSRDLPAARIPGDEDPTPSQPGPFHSRQPISVNGSPSTPCQTPQKGGWFGQLFGASSTPSRDLETRTVKSRRPSSWLPPNVNVLNLIRLLSTPEQDQVFPADKEEKHQSDRKPERSLRALCDHAALAEAQLSFKKGDILQLLGTVDEDWIHCRRGSDTGLVPVGYTSLIL